LTKQLKPFEQLFREHFKPLCGFAMKYVGDLEEAKNLVHEVFISVWEKFDTLPQDTHYRSYLYTSVRNRCLNHLRDRKKLMTLENVAEHKIAEENTAMEIAELEKEIEYAINSLPEKCRQIFELSRHEGLKYQEIAEKLEISIKTVEAQMSKALAVLRTHLGEFLSLIFILIFP
jgi:RNA polymerase sigma-70 factor, ECF subfamily